MTTTKKTLYRSTRSSESNDIDSEEKATFNSVSSSRFKQNVKPNVAFDYDLDGTASEVFGKKYSMKGFMDKNNRCLGYKLVPEGKGRLNSLNPFSKPQELYFVLDDKEEMR